MQEDQQRLVGGRRGVGVERREGEVAVERAQIQIGLAVGELPLLEPLREMLRRRVFQADAEDVEQPDAEPEQAALAAGAR